MPDRSFLIFETIQSDYVFIMLPVSEWDRKKSGFNVSNHFLTNDKS